ncbi:MAG: hypothetical protein K5930_02975 [Treponemataceae bacterium]|nr:hypothetical protein [Treponemataceae bacterium]
MKKEMFILALLSIFFLFAGCASDETPEEESLPEIPAQEAESIPENTSAPEETQIPVEVEEPIIVPEEPEIFTTEWIDLVIDDDENCGYFITTDELGKFSSIEGEFKKDSGNESSCFGFVFGYSSQEEGIVPDYLRFAINVKGEYSIHSWNGSEYKDLLDPEADQAYLYKTEFISTGYEAVNTLRIELDENYNLSFLINGNEVASDIEAFENSTPGVMVFFSVGTDKEENLSENPVKFSYRITDSKSAEE